MIIRETFKTLCLLYKSKTGFNAPKDIYEFIIYYEVEQA